MAAPVSICSGFEYSTRPEYRLYAVIASTWTSFTKCVEEPVSGVGLGRYLSSAASAQSFARLFHPSGAQDVGLTELASVTPVERAKASARSEFALTEAQARLSQMVLDTVRSGSTRRNYAKSLDEVFRFAAGRPLSRELLLEWRTSMDGLMPSTVNVRLAAVRSLIRGATRNGVLGSEQAAVMTDVPNVRQQGTRLGNWLTREQAKELLGVPDRSTLKGKRDYVILALLVGCALRRQELAHLEIEDIQMREGRWVIADLRGKGGRIRTVAVPLWIKQGINTWLAAAELEDGRLLRAVGKSGKVVRGELSAGVLCCALLRP